MVEITALEIHVMQEDGVIQPGFNFEAALHFLKSGKRVCREGWNGKGMWLQHVPEGEWCIAAEDENLVEAMAMDNLPWIGMKTADNKFVPWLCSQTDMLAEDWEIVN